MNILEYDYLKVKTYDLRVQDEKERKSYILSFSDQHHVKIDENAKQIIDLFDGKNRLKDIEQKLENIGIVITEEELKRIVKDILIGKAMLEGTQYTKKKGNSMLWLKVPIIDSYKLRGIFNILKCAFYKGMLIAGMISIILCGIISVYAILNHSFNSDINSVKIMLFSYLSMIIHEFGHVAAAYRYNISVGKIGIGMYMLYPVMYVDMTNAWRLQSRQRVLVDIGGMYFQALTILPLTIIGLISGDIFYFICNIYILAMSVYNLFPFLKLDGYWLFCDYFEINNISTNAFKIIKNELINRKGCRYERKKIYYVFSVVYALSMSFMFGVGIVYSITIIRNWAYVSETSKLIIEAWGNKNYGSAFTNINSILIYIIPLIFILVMIMKGIAKIFGKRKKND